MRRSDERSWFAVPRGIAVALLIALTLQVAWHAVQPKPRAYAAALTAPPPLAALRTASLGEPIVLAQLMTLYLQAFDNQPGISIPFRDLDYAPVIQWLETILSLDERAQYPLLLASQVYAQVPDPARTRMMLEFVDREFQRNPNLRWRWLAHAAIMARHQLKDMDLALRYARDITRLAPAAPGWARQMLVFLLEDAGEVESAKVLLGGLLASGEIKDPHELHFLTERLKALESGEIPTNPTKN